jgi:hypothetical protein
MDIITLSYILNEIEEGINQTNSVCSYPYFILGINKEHGERAKPLIIQSISEIVTGQPNQFKPDMVFQVLPKLMNTM